MPPKVSIDSVRISKAACRAIERAVNAEASAQSGTPCLYQLIETLKALFNEAQERERANASHVAEATASGTAQLVPKKPVASSSSPIAAQKKKHEEEQSTKKASMRTAQDVIDRIRFD